MATQAALICAAVCMYWGLTSAIRMYIEPGQRRCFTEELPSSSKITGETNIATGSGDMDIDVWITTLTGQVLFHKRAPEHGKFTFQTPVVSRQHQEAVEEDDYEYGESNEEDTYKVCIEHQQHPSRAHPHGTRRLVSFVLHQAFSGGDGTDGRDAARQSDTDRLQTTMRNMHATLSGMIGDLAQLQRRERKLTKRMQRTTSRVTVMSIVGLVVTVVTSAVQFRYYQGYFKQKKLC